MQTDMRHPDSERLAALDQEPATAEELAHLAACAVCRAERDAFVALAAMARESANAEVPRLTSWDTLSSALRQEGLLTSTVDITPIATPLVVRALDGSAARQSMAQELAPDIADRSVVAMEHAPPGVPARQGKVPRRAGRAVAGSVPGWMRAAAAVALVAGGVALGRVSAGANAIPLRTVVAASDSATARVNASMGTALQNTSLGGSESFASVQEATVALTEAQRMYERASLWLASNDTTTRSPDVYRARLAALDQMMAASRAALRESPQDPVLNHYFLATYTAREATLQQMGDALPVDKTIESY
jgi:hypothetical protein